MIDPLGTPTLSIGVDNVAYEGDRIRGMGPSPYLQAAEKIYPNREAWGRNALKRLHGWGFNTLGAWSDRELWGEHAPYTVMLDFAARAGADWLRGRPVDVYDPRFEDAALEIARREATPRARDPMLVGYFSDNELWWGPDWRRRDTMLAAYLSFPREAPGRQRAVDFLRQRYGTVQRLNHAWHVAAPDFSRVPPKADAPAYRADADAFLELVAIRYFTVSAAVIRSADPNHLYLGARFAGEPPDPVLRAARAADVVSINLYDRDPRRAVAHVFALAARPVLVSEFSFRALDSGLPNTIGAGPWVFTQQGRARAYVTYVARLVSVPQAIGYHWFRWADEPREGRADGENSNYGLVNLKDAPYALFVDTVTAANQAAVEVHRGAAREIPIPAESLWYHGNLGGIVNTLLGGPRWLLTAIRTLSAYLAHASSQAHT
jgi:agarase